MTQNQPIPVDEAGQPVVTEPEMKSLGEGRWHAKYGKRFPIMVGAAMVFGYGSVKLAQKFQGAPVGLIAGIVIVICLIFAYQRYIHSPAKKAGEEFLAAKPITPFNRIEK